MTMMITTLGSGEVKILILGHSSIVNNDREVVTIYYTVSKMCPTTF